MESIKSLRRREKVQRSRAIKAGKAWEKALRAFEREENAKTAAAYRAARARRSMERRKLDEVRDEIARRSGSVLFVTTFDGVPMARGLALMLEDARDHGARFTVQAADRREGVAEAHGKKSQAMLRRCYERKLATGRCPGECGGDCNPANRPGTSSHELRSDGSSVFASRGFSVGERLPWFMLGIDAWDRGDDDGGGVDDLVRVLRRLGYAAVETYRGQAGERQHMNLVSSPRKVLKRRGIIP